MPPGNGLERIMSAIEGIKVTRVGYVSAYKAKLNSPEIHAVGAARELQFFRVRVRISSFRGRACVHRRVSCISITASSLASAIFRAPRDTPLHRPAALSRPLFARVARNHFAPIESRCRSTILPHARSRNLCEDTNRLTGRCLFREQAQGLIDLRGRDK